MPVRKPDEVPESASANTVRFGKDFDNAITHDGACEAANISCWGGRIEKNPHVPPQPGTGKLEMSVDPKLGQIADQVECERGRCLRTGYVVRPIDVKANPVRKTVTVGCVRADSIGAGERYWAATRAELYLDQIDCATGVRANEVVQLSGWDISGAWEAPWRSDRYDIDAIQEEAGERISIVWRCDCR